MTQQGKNRVFICTVRVCLRTVLFVALILGVALPAIFAPAPKATAASSSYVNYQARLLNSSGSVVADGNYHVEFKLYKAVNSTGSSQGSCSGDSNCLWVETRTTGNLVRVVNGYLTVQLGSVSALPSIDWSQSLWLGVRLGGNGGAASWETIELTSDGTATGNKIPLTAVPYAFTAGGVQSTDQTANSTNSTGVTLRTGNTGGTTSNTGALTIATGDATSGTAGNISIDVGTSSTGNGSILMGTASRAQTLSLGNTNSGTTISLQAGTSGITAQAGSAAYAFQVRDGSNNEVLRVDTTSNVVVLGKVNSVAGNLVFADGTSSNFAVLQTPTLSGTYVLQLPVNVGSTGDCLKLGTVSGSTGPLTFGACGGGGVWQTTGNVANLASSTDNVTVGSATNLAKLGVDGDTDEIQLLVQGNGTQTNNLAVFEQSDGTDVLSVSNSGVTTLAGNLVVSKTATDFSSAVKLNDGTLTLQPSGSVSNQVYGSSNVVQTAGGNSQNFTGFIQGLYNKALIQGTGKSDWTFGAYNLAQYTSTTANAGAVLQGIYAEAQYTGGSTFGSVIGLKGYAQTGTGTISSITGIQGESEAFGANVTDQRSLYAFAKNNGAGTISNLYGAQFTLQNLVNNGVITNAYGNYVILQNGGGASSQIQNGYGLYVATATNSGGGTFASNYGLYIQDQSGVGSTNSYNIYSAGATAKNYFAGTATIIGAASFGDSTHAGSLVVSDGSSSTITIKSATQVAATNYDITVPAITSSDTFCLQTKANCSSGSSPWQTTSNVANLVTSTDDVTIGSATDLGKLGIDGDSDEIQLLVQGSGTQTSNLAVFENSAGSDLVTISGAGALAVTAQAATTADQLTVSNASGATSTNGVDGVSINFNTTGSTASAANAALKVDVTSNNSGATTTLVGIKISDLSSAEANSTETGLYIGANWDVGLDVQSGGLNLAGYTSGGNPSDPAAPAADNLRVYAKKVSGRMLLKIKGPSGVDSPLQPSLFGNNIIMYSPTSGTTVTGGFGTLWAKGSSSGTVSTPTPATTSPAMSNQIHRTKQANAATTQNQAFGIRTSAADSAQFWMGNASGLGGFFFQTRIIIENYPAATVRIFAGLSSSATEVAASDTVAGNVVGLWHSTTDPSSGANSFNLVTRDNTTTTKTSIALSNAIAAGNSYDWYMFVKPNDTTVYYRLDDLVNGVTYEGSTSTTVPRNTIFMLPQVEMSNGTANTTANTVGIGVNRIYIESDH